MDKLIGVVGKGIEGKSIRFGLVFSFEKSGIFIIINFIKHRYWFGIGRVPKYLQGR